MSEPTNSFQQFQSIIDRMEAATNDEADRRWAELEQDIYDRKLLMMQRRYYNEAPVEARRGFIFWYGDGTTYEDERRAAALERMCKRGWFYKFNAEYGMYRITDAGLMA